MRRTILILAVWSATSPIALGEPNSALAIAAIEDARDRQSMRGREWSAEVTKRDAERMKLVMGELRDGRIRESADYFNAAMIAQHGQNADDYRLAGALAWISYAMHEDKESVTARSASYYYALSWDRLMLSLNRPQWYMTQRVRDPKTHGPGELLPNDPSLALPQDKERFSGPRY